ncbi:MAG: hypothetical protein KGY41_01440 [Desulfovermiculus sp.]|nr:hypothetical protein [Desulfovermiculus sp.]
MPLSSLCLGYTSYRLETLPFIRPMMQKFECIVLEEPSTPGFTEMLSQELDIDEYLLLTDFGFPSFAHSQCQLLQEMHAQGKNVLQVEPFLQELVRIHEFFASGGTPSEIKAGTQTSEVYDLERTWTARLLAFYRQAHNKDFSQTVAAVKDFARIDALKGRLRDEMRAQELQNIFELYPNIYVEAGYIHFALLRELYHLLPDQTGLTTFYSQEGYFRPRIGRRQIMGPGDVLTLIYTWRPEYHGLRTDLLAAQSLIYNKVVETQEIENNTDACPHAEDEIQAIRLARSLDYEQCASLYEKIRSLSTQAARETARDWLGRMRQ